MWFLNILILSILFAVQGKSVVKDESETPELKWPTRYTFKATQIFLLAGFTEDYQMWRTENKSRIDYNHGAVKSVVVKQSRGVQYQIHPEDDRSQNSSLVCKKSKSMPFHRVKLEELLPDVGYDYEIVGTELVNDIKYSKFYYQDKTTFTLEEHAIWAVYNTEAKAWVPIRYEHKNTDGWLGFVDKHEIWLFDSFDTNVSEDVFDMEAYCKDAKETEITDNEVTDNLLFLDPEDDAHVEHAFRAFKKKHNRAYSGNEHEMRRAIFQKNMRHISRVNKRNLSYKLTVNHFADRTEAEMVKYRGLLPRPKGKIGTVPFPYSSDDLDKLAETLPIEYDARLDGLVTPVKNQESCGSCWTFGSTASMEGALARSTGKLINLSNQALVDCAWAYGSAGCNGGTDIAAYRWMTEYGLPTEAEYGPYTNTDGFCRIKNVTKTYPIRGFTEVNPYSVTALKVAVVNHGPLTVSVNANSDAFSFYSSGIFYDPSCSSTILNHEVTLVGYGQKDGEDYWIIKNSWDKEWGLDGYIYVSTRDNNCGVTSEPTYVVV